VTGEADSPSRLLTLARVAGQWSWLSRPLLHVAGSMASEPGWPGGCLRAL